MSLAVVYLPILSGVVAVVRAYSTSIHRYSLRSDNGMAV
jgi:hypothetical protein